MIQWCQECVLWKEAAEPGTVIAAPPGADLAPDEAFGVGIPFKNKHEVDLWLSSILTGILLGCWLGLLLRPRYWK
jgi:hypothetical protein